jgi:hypothetical protein
MQNKKQMLDSSRAQRTYAQFYRLGLAATMCRGTTSDDNNFFYSNLPYWSVRCLGWVLDKPGKPKVCQFCMLAQPPKVEFSPAAAKNEAKQESRDDSSPLGQLAYSNSPRSPSVWGLPTGRGHGSKGNTSSAGTKKQEKGTDPLQKSKKKRKR